MFRVVYDASKYNSPEDYRVYNCEPTNVRDINRHKLSDSANSRWWIRRCQHLVTMNTNEGFRALYARNIVDIRPLSFMEKVKHKVTMYFKPGGYSLS